MASTGREERRRRIVERGSDRLALITGQIKSLDDTHTPSPSPMPSPSLSTTSFNTHHAHDADSSGDEKDYSGASEYSKIKSENQVETNYPKPANYVAFKKGILTKPTFFSSKRINSCILASERTRAICSVVIACLVIIAFVDYPLFGINIVSTKNMMVSRPISVILLTDVTVVIARLFREKREAEEDAAEVGTENWGGAVKLLERGLVAYNAIRGMFIDCSIYLVMIICALSMV